jgi:hypothetical protein
MMSGKGLSNRNTNIVLEHSFPAAFKLLKVIGYARKRVCTSAQVDGVSYPLPPDVDRTTIFTLENSGHDDTFATLQSLTLSCFEPDLQSLLEFLLTIALVIFRPLANFEPEIEIFAVSDDVFELVHVFVNLDDKFSNCDWASVLMFNH